MQLQVCCRRLDRRSPRIDASPLVLGVSPLSFVWPTVELGVFLRCVTVFPRVARALTSVQLHGESAITLFISTVYHGGSRRDKSVPSTMPTGNSRSMAVERPKLLKRVLACVLLKPCPHEEQVDVLRRLRTLFKRFFFRLTF